jgi:hypothetical protein
VCVANLLFSYYDLSGPSPKVLPLEMVFSKEDTIAPLLAKVYTARQHSLSPTINLGINPLPLSILPAQFTFLPLVKVHTIRRLIPVARFNVPMIRVDDPSTLHQDQNKDAAQEKEKNEEDVEDSIARVMGYISACEIYKSLRPDLLRLLRESNKTDAFGELTKIEQRSHRRWLAMDVPFNEVSERSGSVGAESEVSALGVKRVTTTSSVATKESGMSKESVGSVAGESVVSAGSRSSGSWDGAAAGTVAWNSVQTAERGDAALDKVQLRREVGAWWGIKDAN